MYQKMGKECKTSLKKQFDFSELELVQMEEFMAGNIDKPVTDILITLMKNVDLNDRQKVVVSYTLGTSVGADTVIQELEESRMVKIDPMLNIKIGQGG